MQRFVRLGGRILRALTGFGLFLLSGFLVSLLLLYRDGDVWKIAVPLLVLSIWILGRFFVRPFLLAGEDSRESLVGWSRGLWGNRLVRAAMALMRSRVSPQRAQLLYDAGLLYYEQCRYAAAIGKLRQAADLFAELDDKLNESLVRMDLGNCLNAAGRHFEAIAALEHALKLWEKLSESQHRDNTWRLFNNLGAAFSEASDFDAAEACFRRALHLRGTDTATCLMNLADLQRRQGSFREAETTIAESIRLIEEKNGVNLGFAIGILAMLRDDEDRLKEAEDLYRQAEELLGERLGHGHIELAKILDRHAALLARAGRAKAAVALVHQAADIRAKLR